MFRKPGPFLDSKFKKLILIHCKYSALLYHKPSFCREKGNPERWKLSLDLVLRSALEPAPAFILRNLSNRYLKKFPGKNLRIRSVFWARRYFPQGGYFQKGNGTLNYLVIFS